MGPARRGPHVVRRKVDYESAVVTGRGDDGTTGLLYGGERISKDDPRAEAYGAVDEAVAALGLARAELADDPTEELARLVLRLQRELFVVGAELATNPAARDRGEDGRTRVSAAMVDGLDAVVQEAEATVQMPREFVVPGETRASASLEVARTAVRRAERRAVALLRTDDLPSAPLLAYLNRLADLLWILARAAEQAAARPATPARLPASSAVDDDDRAG